VSAKRMAVPSEWEAALVEARATLLAWGWPVAVVEAAMAYLQAAATAPPECVARVPAWTAALAVARPAELGVPGEADLETLTVARFRCLQRLLEPSSA
jgi:hypothetical protein